MNPTPCSPGVSSCYTRVKICGITRVEDALAAVNSGADAVGLVFYQPSPRYVELDTARAVANALPPFVTCVGLFVNAEADEVHRVLRAVRLDLLQFHGDETREDCERFGRPYIKAVSVRPGADIDTAMDRYSSARGLLLDTWDESVRGGSGKTFDWSLVPAARALPVVLAGGLTPDNVAQAVRVARPWAVDVSGGVEASKGIKDADKMARFIEQVRRADAV